MSRPNKYRDLWIGAVAIAILGIAGYGHLLEPGTVPYSPHSDIVVQHLGTNEVLHRSLESGHGLPLWRDDQLSGSGAMTNPQAMYTYPLNFLFWLMPPAAATGPTLFLYYLFAV